MSRNRRTTEHLEATVSCPLRHSEGTATTTNKVNPTYPTNRAEKLEEDNNIPATPQLFNQTWASTSRIAPLSPITVVFFSAELSSTKKSCVNRVALGQKDGSDISFSNKDAGQAQRYHQLRQPETHSHSYRSSRLD